MLYGDWVAREFNKALEKLKDKNKPLCMAYLSAFYYLFTKELDLYPELVKHVKDIARWDRMEHVAFEGFDIYEGITIFLDNDTEKNLERLKKEFDEAYLVNIRFFLIKYLKDLENLENFMKTILFHNNTKWGDRIYMDLYFKDGTILLFTDKTDPEIELRVEVNFDNSKIVLRKRIFWVSSEAIKNVLKEGIFSEYIYRIFKTLRGIDRAIRETHKSYSGASVDVIVKANGDVYVDNVLDIAPMEITERLIERVEEIVRNNRLALSDLLREKAVEHMRGLTL